MDFPALTLKSSNSRLCKSEMQLDVLEVDNVIRIEERILVVGSRLCIGELKVGQRVSIKATVAEVLTDSRHLGSDCQLAQLAGRSDGKRKDGGSAL